MQGVACAHGSSVVPGGNDATIKFSQDTKANGHFYCPNGTMNLGNHTDLLGRFWAKKVGSDWNVTMTHSIVPEPTAGVALSLGFLMLRRRRRKADARACKNRVG